VSRVQGPRQGVRVHHATAGRLSGFREMLSIPASTRNRAKSGWSEGACPQIRARPTLPGVSVAPTTATRDGLKKTFSDALSPPKTSWDRSRDFFNEDVSFLIFSSRAKPSAPP
jgi:hypothetical protein